MSFLATAIFFSFLTAAPFVAEGQEQAIAEFMRDSATLGFANLMLEKGLNPLSYDSLLEFKQVVANAKGGIVKVAKMEAFGQTVGSTGNDPVAFYIDQDINKDIIESVRSVAGEALPFNYPFSAAVPSFGPIPPPQGGVLLTIPLFSQTNPQWSTNTIDGCGDTIRGAGCGPTSLTMILNYFGKNVTPPQIASPLRKNVEYQCGAGSMPLGLANLARDQYGLQYKSISPSEIEGQLKQGHPIMGSFRCFKFFGPRDCFGHISVIRGIAQCTIGGKTDTCLYFEDPFITGGEMVFFADTVTSSFGINVLYAFSQ